MIYKFIVFILPHSDVKFCNKCYNVVVTPLLILVWVVKRSWIGVLWGHPTDLLRLSGVHASLSEVLGTMTGACGPYNLGGSVTLHIASLALIFVGLIQRWRLSCLGSLGPPSYTWRGQTDLQTAFLTEATSIGACNRHPGATCHRWMARQCKGWLADALPRLADAPCLSTASSSPTSTPCPLHTIKGDVVLGGDHHSSIQSILSSLEALRSSSFRSSS
jgi:hypothetical protein